ncbi:MAG: chitobiase/beta-hexosaminidase C-terminal domain-containing protein [Saprospiraceae bacterium]|nr:chitobiase/beta-hexosaminidase C-terminal domain-containing protein [Saprospiraceae bacterium]
MIDVSYGRITDGNDQWVLFAEATPASSNDGQARFLNAGIIFSLQDGMYFGTPELRMETDEVGANIHYTLNGKDPSEDDPIYQGPISNTTSTVVSARAFKPAFAGQKTTRGTYLIDESSDVFHLNLQIDPKYLWDDETGMYVAGSNGVTGFCSEEPRNWNQDWEYPGQVTLFEPDGRMAFKVNAVH